MGALILPLAIGSTNALAKGGKKGECKMGFERGIFRKIDLTEEQKTQIKDMMEQRRESCKVQKEAQREAHMAEKKALKANEHKLILADSFDEQQANELATQMIDAHKSRYVESLKARHELMSLLTDEQKAQVEQLMAERMEKAGERSGKHNKKKDKKDW